MLLVALMGLIPTGAFAHGPDGHPPDPNLHVDPTLKDCSVMFAPELTQEAFGRFVREFGSTSAFKSVAAPMTLRRGGVLVAIEQINFKVDEHADSWNDTFYHPDSYHELGSDLSFPKVRLRVGVSDRVDLGAFWTKNMNANYGWVGFEGRYGILRQTETMPISLAARLAYTKTLYVHDMDMHALTADVTAGRTFWGMLTPYVGVGGDLVYALETSDAVQLHSETQPVSHALAGVELRYWHVSLGAELNQAALRNFQFQVAAAF